MKDQWEKPMIASLNVNQTKESFKGSKKHNDDKVPSTELQAECPVCHDMIDLSDWWCHLIKHGFHCGGGGGQPDVNPS